MFTQPSLSDFSLSILAFCSLLLPFFYLSLILYEPKRGSHHYHPLVVTPLLVIPFYLLYYYICGLLGLIGTKSLGVYLVFLVCVFSFIDYRKGFVSISRLKQSLPTDIAGFFLLLFIPYVLLGFLQWDMEFWDVATANFLSYSKDIVRTGKLALPPKELFTITEICYYYSPINTMWIVLERLIRGNDAPVHFLKIVPCYYFSSFVILLYTRLRENLVWFACSLALIVFGSTSYLYLINIEEPSFTPFFVLCFIAFVADWVDTRSRTSLICGLASFSTLYTLKGTIAITVLLSLLTMMMVQIDTVRNSGKELFTSLKSNWYLVLFFVLLAGGWNLIFLFTYQNPTFPHHSFTLSTDATTIKIMNTLTDPAYPIHFSGPGYLIKVMPFKAFLQTSVVAFLVAIALQIAGNPQEKTLIRNCIASVLAFLLMVVLCIPSINFSHKFFYILMPPLAVITGYSLQSVVHRVVEVLSRTNERKKPRQSFVRARWRGLCFGAFILVILFHFFRDHVIKVANVIPARRLLLLHPVLAATKLKQNLRSLPNASFKSSWGRYERYIELLNSLDRRQKDRLFMLSLSDYIAVLSHYTYDNGKFHVYPSPNDYKYFFLPDSAKASINGFSQFLKREGFDYVLVVDINFYKLVKTFGLPFSGKQDLLSHGYRPLYSDQDDLLSIP